MHMDYVIQIYVGQKAKENQWIVMVLEEFLHTTLVTVWSDQYQKDKCDLAWENRAYVHIKFDYIFRL